MTRRDEIIQGIATRILRLETLERRRSDQLDFHELAVWQIKEALEAAFDAGREQARRVPVETVADHAE